MINIEFASDSLVRPECPCRVCGVSDAKLVLIAEGAHGVSYLFRCPACASLYFDGKDPVIGYQGFVSEAFWLDYVQSGAGITTMLAPLNALHPIPAGDLIDVGCGFGFVVDYWSTTFADAIGLEKSYYGEVGKSKLGVDIRAQYLDEFRRSEPQRQFAIVYSSEVIEHTPDPEAFMDDLVSMLAEHSILVLTTPSVTAIKQTDDRARLIAALSPGFHYAILSEQIMQDMLVRRGLNFQIRTNDGQMIVWASRSALPQIDYGKSDWTSYFAYLERLSQNNEKHLALGALVRILKDGMNTGHPLLAQDAWKRLLPLAHEVYGINLFQPDIAKLLEIREPLAELDRFPSWLGNALLFGGLHVGHHYNDRVTKLRMIDAALSVMRRRADVDLQFGQEAQSFLPFAERQYIIALSESLTTSLLQSPLHVEDDLRSSLDVLKGVIDSLPVTDPQEVKDADYHSANAKK